MPLIRKIQKSGKTSKVITLPKSWLEYQEQETGRELTHVTIEVGGRTLIVKPLIKKEG